MTKTAGQICAEVFKKYNKGSVDMAEYPLNFVDLGVPTLILKMYYALIKNGFKGTNAQDPSSMTLYVSKLLASDCESKKGCWMCEERMSYWGKKKIPVNVYRPRK